VTTTSPDEALRIAASKSPRAMLLDLHMGDADGLEVLEKLREDGYPGLSFVLSGDDSFAAAHRASLAGADGYLVKSPRLDLPKALRRFLARAKRSSLAPLSEATRAYLETRGLTEWEMGLVEELAADGANEKEIAARTGRSETAVRKAFETIRKKLGAKNQHDLARMLGVLSCLGGRSCR